MQFKNIMLYRKASLPHLKPLVGRCVSVTVVVHKGTSNFAKEQHQLNPRTAGVYLATSLPEEYVNLSLSPWIPHIPHAYLTYNSGHIQKTTTPKTYQLLISEGTN